MHNPTNSIGRCAWIVALVAMVSACDAPDPVSDLEAPDFASIYKNDKWRPGFVQNPDFVPVPLPATGSKKFALSTEGAVVLIEGEAPFVSAGAGGGFGIMPENQRAIVQEVLETYPDRFDTVAIFLSFTDQAAAGSAYYQNVANDVDGIGRMTFNGRRGWGLPDDGGRFSGFVNMNSVEQFGGLRSAGSPFSGYHSVLAQELTHRWLFFFAFQGADGQRNDALIGRMDAHWSRLADSDGSVQDGVNWRDNGDGSFTALGQDNAFAPLDLYGMGIYGPDQVPPIWYITEATLGGMPLNKDSRIPNGATIMGNRISPTNEVTMAKIIAQNGPRNPPKGTETPYYRAAFVLVTAPGQARAEWAPYLTAVQQAAETFPQTYKEWSLKAGAICTTVAEPWCPEPELDLHDHTIRDGDDDLVGPGDSFDLHLRIRNDGYLTAADVKVSLASLTSGVTIETTTITVASVEEDGVAEVPVPFRINLPSSVECGDTVTFRVRMTTKEGPTFFATLDMVIGNRTIKFDALHEAPDWTVDPDGTDTAAAGAWDLGEPDFISILGVVTQPPADHSPGEGKLSFHTGPAKGDSFSSHDVDGGNTTLESPVFAIGDARYPSLVFYAWHVALDFAASRDGPVAVPGSDLIVSASNDGGKTYVELIRISENTQGWKRYAIPLLPTIEPSNRVRFRFVVEDPTAAGTVEAGIDDIELIELLASCPIPDTGMTGPDDPDPVDMMMDDEGCGCGTSGRSTAALFLLLPMLFLVRRYGRKLS